jgi:hypothetical protein
MRRMMNDPSRDVEKEMKKYFFAAYGPAAAEGAKFFSELERLFVDFWRKTVPAGKRSGMVTPWRYNQFDVQRSLWTLTYTEKTLKHLDAILKEMEKKTAGTIYARQTHFLRKYLLDEIMAERKRLFAAEDRRQSLSLKVTAVKGVPAESDWTKAPVQQLQSAERFQKVKVVPGTFRVLTDGKNLYFRANLQEPFLARSKSIQRRNGSSAIWQDNTFELFFYSMADKNLRQIVINDLGFWSSCISHRAKWTWKQLPGIKVTCKKGTDSWQADITVPLASINPKGGAVRFNATRERNIKGLKAEFSTWSSLSKLGEWHNYHTFPDLLLK